MDELWNWLLSMAGGPRRFKVKHNSFKKKRTKGNKTLLQLAAILLPYLQEIEMRAVIDLGSSFHDLPLTFLPYKPSSKDVFIPLNMGDVWGNYRLFSTIVELRRPLYLSDNLRFAPCIKPNPLTDMYNGPHHHLQIMGMDSKASVWFKEDGDDIADIGHRKYRFKRSLDRFVDYLIDKKLLMPLLSAWTICPNIVDDIDMFFCWILSLAGGKSRGCHPHQLDYLMLAMAHELLRFLQDCEKNYDLSTVGSPLPCSFSDLPQELLPAPLPPMFHNFQKPPIDQSWESFNIFSSIVKEWRRKNPPAVLRRNIVDDVVVNQHQVKSVIANNDSETKYQRSCKSVSIYKLKGEGAAKEDDEEGGCYQPQGERKSTSSSTSSSGSDAFESHTIARRGSVRRDGVEEFSDLKSLIIDWANSQMRDPMNSWNIMGEDSHNFAVQPCARPFSMSPPRERRDSSEKNEAFMNRVVQITDTILMSRMLIPSVSALKINNGILDETEDPIGESISEASPMKDQGWVDNLLADPLSTSDRGGLASLGRKAYDASDQRDKFILDILQECGFLPHSNRPTDRNDYFNDVERYSNASVLHCYNGNIKIEGRKRCRAPNNSDDLISSYIKRSNRSIEGLLSYTNVEGRVQDKQQSTTTSQMSNTTESPVVDQ
eukprot:GHVH01008786.1.p1 GENE.GHVH01008786.1~~GHVH01008786.1.p1  ORF type:complete len:656 (+),score=77.47 GHVH01008786.1:432-2399(+)